jgi:hypothetical protein
LAEFTIVAAEHKKDMPPKEGMRPSQVVALSLQDISGAQSHSAEWITSKDTDVAALVGTRTSGTLEPTPYGMRFKKDRPAFGGGGGFRPRDPKESAAIQRQHSQGVAVALLHVKAIAGKLTEEDLTPAKIRALTDHFDDDIAAGVERKHPSQKTINGLPVHNEPVRTGAPEPTTPTADYEPTPADGSEPFAA